MTLDEIMELLQDHLLLDVEDPDCDLIESGELDSLKFVELILAVEQQTHEQLSPKDLDLDDLRTPRTIAKAFRAMLGADGAGDEGGPA